MKKTVVLLLTLLLALACFAFHFVSSSGEDVPDAERSYSYSSALDEYGIHGGGIPGQEKPNRLGAYVYDEILFSDGLWTYEYLDLESGVYKPMTAFFQEKQDGWVHGNWSNIYTAAAESAWTEDGYTYCSVLSNGKALHPGNSSGAAVTFIAPKDGTVSYNASLYRAGYGSSDDSDLQKSKFAVSLWVNGNKVFPQNGEDFYLTSEHISAEDPVKFSLSAVKIQQGDRIRLCVAPDGNDNRAGYAAFVDLPAVVYLDEGDGAETPGPGVPSGITVVPSEDGKYYVITWSEAEGAAGYHLYLKTGSGEFEKLNDTPVTGSTYQFPAEEETRSYELYLTAVFSDGTESAPSESVRFKRYVDRAPTDTASDLSNTGSSVEADGPPDSSGESSFHPGWILPIAAAGIVFAGLAVFLCRKKK